MNKNKENDDKLFIQIIRSNPWIYDPKYKKVYDKEAKQRMWEKLQKTFAKYGLHIIDPINKWTGFRTKFNNHDKINNTSWPFYNDLLFLKAFIRRRQTSKASQRQPVYDQPSTSADNALDGYNYNPDTEMINVHEYGGRVPTFSDPSYCFVNPTTQGSSKTLAVASFLSEENVEMQQVNLNLNVVKGIKYEEANFYDEGLEVAHIVYDDESSAGQTMPPTPHDNQNFEYENNVHFNILNSVEDEDSSDDVILIDNTPSNVKPTTLSLKVSPPTNCAQNESFVESNEEIRYSQFPMSTKVEPNIETSGINRSRSTSSPHNESFNESSNSARTSHSPFSFNVESNSESSNLFRPRSNNFAQNDSIRTSYSPFPFNVESNSELSNVRPRSNNSAQNDSLDELNAPIRTSYSPFPFNVESNSELSNVRPRSNNSAQDDSVDELNEQIPNNIGSRDVLSSRSSNFAHKKCLSEVDLNIRPGALNSLPSERNKSTKNAQQTYQSGKRCTKKNEKNPTSHFLTKQGIYHQPRMNRTVSNSNSGKKASVVPKMDKFAEKKKASINKREETENEIIKCCQDARRVNSEALQLIRLQTENERRKLGETSGLNPHYRDIIHPRVTPPAGF